MPQVPGQAPYIPGSSSTLRPKPILVDKQTSEPNTPTNKHFERPMTRGYSDVAHRMKKRVTLRYDAILFSLPLSLPEFRIAIRELEVPI